MFSLSPPSRHRARIHAARIAAAAIVRLRWRSGDGWCCSLLLLAGAALHWVILPHIDRLASAARERRPAGRSGCRCASARSRAQADGWAPVVRAARRGAARRRRPARRCGCRASSPPSSPRSLLAAIVRLEPRVDQLFVDGAELDVRRDARGRLFVAGLDLSAATRPQRRRRRRRLVLRQREFVMRGGTLRWTDEQRRAPRRWRCGDVDFVLRNGVRRHALRLDATPPPGWGERFTLRGQFRQPLLSRARRLAAAGTAAAYAELPHADLTQLRRHVELPFELTRRRRRAARLGRRARRPRRRRPPTWRCASVAPRSAPAAEPLALRACSGRIVAAERAGRGFELATAAAAPSTPATACDWPAGNLRAALDARAEAAGGRVAGGSFSADRIDLARAGADRRPAAARRRRRSALIAALRAARHGRRRAGRVGRAARRAAAATALQAQARGAVDRVAAGRRAAPSPAGPGLRDADVRPRRHREAAARRGCRSTAARSTCPACSPSRRCRSTGCARSCSGSIEPARRGAARGGIGVQVKEATLRQRRRPAAFGASWHTGPGDGHGRGGRFPGVLRPRRHAAATAAPTASRATCRSACPPGRATTSSARCAAAASKQRDVPRRRRPRRLPGLRAGPAGRAAERRVPRRRPAGRRHLAYVPPAAGSRRAAALAGAHRGRRRARVRPRLDAAARRAAAASPAWRWPACRRASPT